MPEELNREERKALGALWASRIQNADEVYNIWASKYKVETLEEFYYGQQWGDASDLLDYLPYVKNLFFTGIDIKQPSIMFQSPRVYVKPRPSKMDWDPDSATKRAALREAVINYFISSDYMDFEEEVGLSILDAFFRFGVLEIGYSADWIDNPEAVRPELDTDTDPDADIENPVIVKQTPKIPKNERLYAKHIPSKKFRVGGIDNRKLSRCSWWGYREYVLVENLRAHPQISEEDLQELTIDRTFDYADINEANADERDEKLNRGDIVEIFKVWDRFTHTKHILCGSSLLLSKPFKRNPIITFKFRERLSSFYPFPLTYNWLSPQIDANEVREAARNHRRRFQRKYITPKNAFDEEELGKLQSGGDGTIVQTNLPDGSKAVLPVQNADLGQQHQELLLVTKSDFDDVSAVTAQSRGEAAGERTTATETEIINTRANIRETRDVKIVKKFIVKACKEILKQAKDKLTEDFWVKIVADSELELEENGVEIVDTWLRLNSENLGDEDFDVEIDVSTLSPVREMEEKQAYIEFITLLSTNQFILLDVDLVRETALRVGYKNEKIIKKFQQNALAMQLALQGQAAAAQAGGQENQNNAAGNTRDLESARNNVRGGPPSQSIN